LNKIEFVRNVIRTYREPSLSAEAAAPKSFLDARIVHHEYAEIGFELLRSRKVAALMATGGLSTRMGGDTHRGNLIIGPVTNRSIFRLQGEKIAAIKRQYSPEMLWLVMTSPAVHNEVVRSFQQENYFGVSPDDIRFFMQASLPILDIDQNPVALAEGVFIEAPTGHGGLLEALSHSSLLTELLKAGIDYLFYFQYPNVLERICDPVMLGYHHSGGFDVTTKAVFEYKPGEKTGKCLEVNGRLQIVEYHFFNNQSGICQETLPTSIATYVWNTSFLQRCVARSVQLPFHVVTHNATAGPPRSLQKVEQFVFDLLPYAYKTGLILVVRDEEYAAVKSKVGADSLESGRNALARLYRKWLERAGATPLVPEEISCCVEISPLFALDPIELKDKLPCGFTYDDGLVLE
jgi:UDP-N-acetylglucosamine/UDP-N-acetylgalactosamine diphosphorylase